MPLSLTVMDLPHMTLLFSKSQKPVTLIHIEVCLYFNNCRNCKNSIRTSYSGSANRCNNNSDSNKDSSSDTNSNSNGDGIIAATIVIMTIAFISEIHNPSQHMIEHKSATQWSKEFSKTFKLHVLLYSSLAVLPTRKIIFLLLIISNWKSRGSNYEFNYTWDWVPFASDVADIYMPAPPHIIKQGMRYRALILSDLIGSSGTISQPI